MKRKSVYSDHRIKYILIDEHVVAVIVIDIAQGSASGCIEENTSVMSTMK